MTEAVTVEPTAEQTAEQGRLDLGDGDYDVDEPDLAVRYAIDDEEAGA